MREIYNEEVLELEQFLDLFLRPSKYGCRFDPATCRHTPTGQVTLWTRRAPASSSFAAAGKASTDRARARANSLLL